LITLPVLTKEIPWADTVLIITASTTGSETSFSAIHSTIKFAPEPPLVSVLSTTKSGDSHTTSSNAQHP
jgi:hypothetical protein